jgi:hypothetical protein
MIKREAGEPFQPCMLREGILIPQALLKDPTLSASARLLWGILAAYQGKSLECFPLEETLAGFLGVQVRQLQSYLKELQNYTRGDPPKAFPLLAVKQVWVKQDQKTRNCYSLLWQLFLEADPQEAGTKTAHLANGGKAQSLAHRSGSDPQDTTPERPGIPRDDGGGVADGRPPSDAQSLAHRSGSDPQDTTPERPGIPRDDGGVADGLPPSDAQYPAHRSEGDPQNIAAERPAIPRDDDGTVADGRPPSDTQYPAHRSEGNPRDTAAERPAIPGGDAGTVPDAMQPGDAGARVVSTPSRELSRPQTQPLAPVLPRYAARPIGQGDCMRHSSTGKCKTCGATVNPIHILMGGMNGVFCERCCPARHSGA